MQLDTPNTPLSNLRDLPNPFYAHRTPGKARIVLTDPSTNYVGDGIGELRINGSGADIVLKDLAANLERDDRFGYRLATGGKELLRAGPSGQGLERLRIHVSTNTYEARVSPLRNTATVLSDGHEAAQVSGGLLGLKYRIHFSEMDLHSPLVAIVAFFHLLVVRSRAFRATPVHVSPGGL